MTISPETTRLDPGSKSDWPCTISSGRRLCSRKVRRDSTSHSAHCRSNWRAAPGRCHRRRRLPRRRSTRPRRLLRAERCVAPCMMRAFSLRTAHFTVWKSDITGSDGEQILTPPSAATAGAARRADDRPGPDACCARRGAAHRARRALPPSIQPNFPFGNRSSHAQMAA